MEKVISDNPIRHFDYLFNREGIAFLRKNFVEDRDGNRWEANSYDPINDVLTKHNYDIETGEWESITSSFADFFTKKTDKIFYSVRNQIDDHIISLSDEKLIKNFLEFILRQLDFFIFKINSSNEEKFIKNKSLESINSLHMYLTFRYKYYITPELITHALMNEESGKTEMFSSFYSPYKDEIRSFEFKPFSLEIIDLLHNELIKHNYISKHTDREIFRKAFSHTKLSGPLEIQWIALGRNKKVNKHLLLYLINQLTRAGFILEEGNPKTLFNTISYVFVDHKGDQLKNFYESSYAFFKDLNKIELNKSKKKTKDQSKIDIIVQELIKLKKNSLKKFT